MIYIPKRFWVPGCGMNAFDVWVGGLGKLGASIVNSVEDVLSFFQSREVLRELPRTSSNMSKKKIRKMVKSLKRRGMLEKTVFLL